MERYICIHGHFYQPPRENPWLEAVEQQDSAYPYHDWNERITAECYAPNSVARILDDQGRIARLVNNYAWMSFNFGPTLLSWLQERSPEVYAAILEADRVSREHFSGHGSALAQVYNHVIMPLASRCDKVTQVLWGIRDFEHRFGRRPEGMWLAETAADLETLEVLAEQGIRFTILSPYQARRCRPVGQDTWQDVSGGRIDPTRPYLQPLPSGRSISLFFYDGPISRAVAFERLLARGETFVARLMGGFSDSRSWPQLVHIATDGESYGHHHHHGDMALAAALDRITRDGRARLTNYGEFLERCPPDHEVGIFENSSWSCSHGVERWRDDCGCRVRADWSQGWRRPLREALDWLRDTLAPAYERLLAIHLKDPWAARDDAIHIILDRSPENIARFFQEHALRELTDEQRVIVLKLLEMQRQAQLMYTSCGWFFDEISGLESVQVLQYAGRAIQLAQELLSDFRLSIDDLRLNERDGQSSTAEDEPQIENPKSKIQNLEEGFLRRIEKAQSNLPEHGNGRRIYEKFVKNAEVGWEQIGAHYAVSSLFESYSTEARFFCYTAVQEEFQSFTAGRAKLVVGRVHIRSEITRESCRLSLGVLHFGDHHVSAGVRAYQGEKAFDGLAREASSAFERGDFAEVIRLFDRAFGESTYSLKSLFRDEQRKVLKRVLHPIVLEAETVFRSLHEHHLPTMRFLAGIGAPLPRAFEMAAEFLFNTDLRWDLKDEEPDVGHIRNLFREADTLNVKLDAAGLAYRLRKTLARMAERLRAQTSNVALLRALDEVVEMARALPFEVDVWQPQNVYFELARTVWPDFLTQIEGGAGGTLAEGWLEAFLHLGEKLGVRIVELREQLAEAKSMPTAQDLVQEVMDLRRIPRATYRLQFNCDFPFAAAREQVDYLAALGISDLYASPILAARPGSMHGYDICDHTRINPELGDREGFESMAEALRSQGLGLILDTVPNHMGIAHPSNVWWKDVLENGPSSAYASWFDIDWDPVNPNLENKVLLPILGDQYGTVLEAGQIRLSYDEGAFSFRYWDHQLPVEPSTYAQILRPTQERLAETLGIDDDRVRELESILTALSYLPAHTETDPGRVTERTREKEVIKGRIVKLVVDSPEVAAALDEVVRQFNGRPGEPASFDLLDGLLDAQAFRPAYWRVATEEINYRRFFDINELAAICVERPEVFEAMHQVFFALLAEGKASGLRIDHPDGLWDPTDYFRKLQEHYVLARVEARVHPRRLPETILDEVRAICDSRFANADWRGEEKSPSAVAIDNPKSKIQNRGWPLYVVAEKILMEDEELPRAWTVDGTTGYDFLNLLNGLFVNPVSANVFAAIHARFLGQHIDFHHLVNSTKKMIMHVSMASEINALSHQLDRISERNRRYRDFTLNSLTFVIREIIACLPVYRTYVTGPDQVTVRDRSFMEAAVEEAKQLNPRTAESIFDFVRDTLLLRNVQDFREEDRPQLLAWAMRFQQVTGPVMAKGVEDTALYVFNPLVSLNEVGGHPDRFGVSPEHFHRVNAERQRTWPHALLATSTHDTKRSEDVRARLNVLSEIPQEWEAALNHWAELNADKKTLVDELPAPDPNDEYLLYQTLLGTWPAGPLTAEVYGCYRDRIAAYMQKATKEAKVHTSWVNANEEYDDAVRDFVYRILPAAIDHSTSATAHPEDPFLANLLALQRKVAFHGYFNSLSQVLLKCTCPGVPDFYQGTELWDLNLVDPDNRRPVDYNRRRHLLSDLARRLSTLGEDRRPLTGELFGNLEDGRSKLFVTWQALACRQAHEGLFAEGTYQPLPAEGDRREHVCAFLRALNDATALMVVPRLLVGLMSGRQQPPTGGDVWQNTWLPLPEEERGHHYRNWFTGEVLVVEERDGCPGLWLAAVLGSFPVALLIRLTDKESS
jgi:(1->4)-alpha-D-glucan 1-alpha-D-glucosylmutase